MSKVSDLILFWKNKFFYLELVIMGFKLGFMTENLASNNIESDQFNLKNKERDYINLISKLEEIKTKIALLEKTKFK